MSRREDAIWEHETGGKWCRWCRTWPRKLGQRCWQCGHVDGSVMNRRTARPGSLSPSLACRSLYERQRIKEENAARRMEVLTTTEPRVVSYASRIEVVSRRTPLPEQ